MVREGRVLTSTAGKPTFGGSGYYVTAYEVGAQVASASSGDTVTVRAGHGFAANDKGIVFEEGSAARYFQVGSVTSLQLTLAGGQTLSVAAGEYLVNLGADQGFGAPQYDGSGAVVYTDMDYANIAVGSTVQTTDDGRYRYFHDGSGAIWELVRSDASTPFALYIDTTTSVSSGGEFNVMDFGAAGDGVTDDYDAINSAMLAATASGGVVYFPSSSGGYVIDTADIAFPYTVGIRVDMNAILLPATGNVVRIQGPIDAGMYQIFGGAGTIEISPASNTEVLYGPVSIAEAPIQWWGAFPNTTADCGPTIQEALAALAPGTFLTFHGGTFKIATGVALTQRYFNMRGETGGYHPGAGYPTFIWTGADDGIMFEFTNPFGIKVEMCAFDGDFSADTVFRAESDSAGTVSWNCYFEKCTFTACRGPSLDLGGGHATYNDDFSQALFLNCWFDRPAARTSDASGNSLTLSSIAAGNHVRIRAWNSYNVKFDNCHFFSLGDSSDANQYDRVGVQAEGGYLVFDQCLFYNIGTDIYIANPSPGLLPSQIEVYGGESQSEEFLRTYTGTGYTSSKNSLIMGLRHTQSFATYVPTRTTSIYWDGPGYNNQCSLVLVGNNFHHNVEIGANAGWVSDLGNRFAVGMDFTGTVASIFGLLGSRGTTNRAAYGQSLRMGSNIMHFGSTDSIGSPGFVQNDIRFNFDTSDLTLARDFLLKQVQAGGSSGKLNPFFGSMNYEGNTTTSINGAADFVKSYAGTTLTLTTKIVLVANAVYEYIWRSGVGNANLSQDSGVADIYVMRDTIAAADSWGIEAVAISSYNTLGGTDLTGPTAHFFDGNVTESVAITYAATIPTNYVLRIKHDTMSLDVSSTYYGIIRRIM